MKEKPILFSGPMVRAILEGRKTQTRRLFKGKDYRWWQSCGGELGDDGMPVAEDSFGDPVTIQAPCHVGDILWVREQLRKGCGWEYAADGAVVWVPAEHQSSAVAWAHHKKHDHCVSIHMPRWACRIRLEVMEVRCQRLQDIAEEDAKAEGVAERALTPGMHPYHGSCVHCGDFYPRHVGIAKACFGGHGTLFNNRTYRGGFACLWDSLHGNGAWQQNPYLWAYSFRRLT